jgi:hypothetical protein
LEAVQEIFIAAILVKEMLGQEDARVILTKTWEHDHGKI